MRTQASQRRARIRTAEYIYTALFEPAEEGGYTVTVPALPGVITEGNTFEEARSGAREGELKRSTLAKILKRAKLTLEDFLRHDP